jgi:class 3 adenylate cyclase
MQSLWRIPWLWGLFCSIFLVILCLLLGGRVVAGIEIGILALFLTFASTWGVFHPRRVLALSSLALRDALLASVVLFLLTRGILAVSSVENERSLTDIPIATVFLPLASGVVSVLLFPIIVGFNLTLIALAGMLCKKDSGAERSMLPLFWPIFLISVVFDLLILTQGAGNRGPKDNPMLRFWPVMGATLFSPLTTIGFLKILRKQGKDFTTLLQGLNQLLQRKCTRRHGWGPKDFRGLVLGGTTASLTLILLSSPLLHSFIAPYEGISYSTATQFASQTSLFLNLLGQSGSNLNGTHVTALLPIDLSKRQALQQMVLISYDDSARHAALKTSEANLQAQLINRIRRGQPKAIILPLSGSQDGSPFSTFLRSNLPIDLSSGNPNSPDYPSLAKAITAAKNVYLMPLSALREGELPKNSPSIPLLRSAYKLASHRLEAINTPEIVTINLKSTPPPLALLLAGKEAHLPANSESSLIDFRQDLKEIRLPIAASQVLQNQSLYDPISKSWKPAEEFFRGKYVFIEPLAPKLHATPLGLRSEMEVHAQATATLLQKEPLRSAPVIVTALVTLLFSALIGQLCVGRAPLESLWKIIPPLLFMVGGHLVIMAFTPLSMNLVLPLLGGILTFLIVTQFTFAVERDQRARNRELLGRFVSPKAIEEILDDPEGKLGLGGKRRRIVVLFVDVRGFSSFAEKRTPEEVVTTMNRYLAVMTDALNAHEGILDKYTGDGLMALFLVEEQTEGDDVLRAVRASQEMAKAVQELAKTIREEGGDELAVGMGLHYGEAVVGMVGHPTRQINYTALGHTVVVSARLQALASGGEIILSEAVYLTLPEGSIAGEAGESVTVKGVVEPVPIYRLHVL